MLHQADRHTSGLIRPSQFYKALIGVRFSATTDNFLSNLRHRAHAGHEVHSSVLQVPSTMLLTCRYAREEAAESKRAHKGARNLFSFTLLRVHLPDMAVQGSLTVFVSMFRVLSAVGFRGYIRWLKQAKGNSNTDDGWGWMWALLLIAFQVLQIMCQHKQIWCGMRMGLHLKQEVRALVSNTAVT
jgi:hypothetical protein